MRIIGLTGYAQHGKDTLADMLVEKGYVKFAFAQQLKDMVYDLNPSVYDSGMEMRLQELVDDVGWDNAKLVPEVRRLLQVFGTEVMREHFGEDVWVDLLGKRLDDEFPARVVITDCRFPNEAAAIRRWGGVLLRINRLNPNGTPYENGISKEHASEAHIASLPVTMDWTFATGDLELMRWSADIIDKDYEGYMVAQQAPQMPTRDEMEDLFR
jgi:hypothetical protein